MKLEIVQIDMCLKDKWTTDSNVFRILIVYMWNQAWVCFKIQQTHGKNTLMV